MFRQASDSDATGGWILASQTLDAAEVSPVQITDCDHTQ